jgi:hypothetical protein
MLEKHNFNTKFYQKLKKKKKKFYQEIKFLLKIMCLWLSYKKKIWGKKYIFSSLKSLKKEVGSGVGSISQRYGSVDPDQHQKVTDPQHWYFLNVKKEYCSLSNTTVRYFSTVTIYFIFRKKIMPSVSANQSKGKQKKETHN